MLMFGASCLIALLLTHALLLSLPLTYVSRYFNVLNEFKTPFTASKRCWMNERRSGY